MYNFVNLAREGSFLEHVVPTVPRQIAASIAMWEPVLGTGVQRATWEFPRGPFMDPKTVRTLIKDTQAKDPQFTETAICACIDLLWQFDPLPSTCLQLAQLSSNHQGPFVDPNIMGF